jgi:proline iminopeptidase
MRGWLLCVAVLAGCSNLGSEGEMLFVRNEGADLPVWVRGNLASDKVIILLAGGPGDPSATYVGEATAQLEARYLTVYWDQRLGGNAQGNASAATLSLEQLVADTAAVVETIRLRYPGRRIFLLSVSWGSELAVGYLATPSHQAGIAGWIDVDGSHNWIQNRLNQLDWIEQRAQAFVESGSEVSYWEGAIAFARANRQQPLTRAGLVTARDYITRAGGFGRLDLDLAAFAFASPLSLFSVLSNADTVVNAIFASPEFQDELSLTSKLPNLTLPVQLLWGANDGVVPIAMAHEVLSLTSTPPAEKSLIVIEDAAHLMPFEKAAEFSTSVMDFVEAH